MKAVIVSGYRGAFDKMEWTRTWARRFEECGLSAVAYSVQDPVADLRAIAAKLDRFGVFACSGHGPTALASLLPDFPAKPECIALEFPYTFDAAVAAQQFGFADPLAGFSADDLRTDVPMLIVRNGRDEMPGLNASLDTLVTKLLSRDVELTLLNQAEAPHALESPAIVAQIVDFMKRELARQPAT